MRRLSELFHVRPAKRSRPPAPPSSFMAQSGVMFWLRRKKLVGS